MSTATRTRFRSLWIALAVVATLTVIAVVYFGPLKIINALVISYSEDTEYAPGYTEKAFRNIVVGDSESDVTKALGAPLDESAATPQVSWLYTPAPAPDYPGRGQPPANASHTQFHFREDNSLVGISGQISHGTTTTLSGTVSSVTVGDHQNSLSLSDADIADLRAKNATQAQIETKFGKPDAVFESRVTRWLRYSHSPGSTHFRMREIGLDAKGLVVRKRSEIYWD